MPVRVTLLLSICLLISVAFADDRIADQHCKTAIGGQVICPPPGGSIAANALGNAVCGHGECQRNAAGVWMCAVEPGGHVGRTASGQVVCTGGCEPAAARLCETAH